MITTIVIDDIGNQATALDKALLLQDISTVAETLVVSLEDKPDAFTCGQWIKSDSLVDGLFKANDLAATKRVIVLSASLSILSSDLARFIAEVETSSPVEHFYIAPKSSDGSIEIPDLSPERIIEAIARSEEWPMLLIATNRLTISALAGMSSTSVCEALLRSLIRAIADGDTLSRSSAAEPSISANMVRALCHLDGCAMARVLSTTIDAMNIEDLFPNHAWKEFSQESAAAVYHSLAALFIRFGDTESANQCLGHSERLEESPRLFALKGLIQHSKGETLGAVANMVSSLQCYETRKNPDGKHYMSFKPKNLEIIASRLVDGLNALNRQDNDKALTHFSEAIFNFDSFYSEHGVQSLEKLRT
jgi:hypothetical protein